MPKCKKVFKNLSLGFYTDTIPIENDVFTSRCWGMSPRSSPEQSLLGDYGTERKAGMEPKETGDWEKLLASGCLKDG